MSERESTFGLSAYGGDGCPRLISDQQDLAELAEIEATGRALAFMLMIAVVWVLLRLGYSIGLATELKGQQFSDK